MSGNIWWMFWVCLPIAERLNLVPAVLRSAVLAPGKINVNGEKVPALSDRSITSDLYRSIKALKYFVLEFSSQYSCFCMFCRVIKLSIDDDDSLFRRPPSTTQDFGWTETWQILLKIGTLHRFQLNCDWCYFCWLHQRNCNCSFVGENNSLLFKKDLQ